MSRRFTLFAILAAACLLFVSCGGLFTSSSTEITFGKTKSDTKPVASTTTSIRIPLPSRTQRTAMDPSAPNTPLELCDSYKFTLKSTDDEYSAAADADDQFIEFPEVEYGTYTITATAYGKLGDGKTTAIANYSQSNIVVDKASVTITVKFTLTENAKIYLYGYTGTPVTNADGSTTQPTYAGKDGKTLLSEKTTSSDGRTETEISYAVDLETGENTTDAQGNPVVTKTVVTETRASGDEKVTTTEFSLNEAEEGCSKRITIEEGTKTTVKKYDDNSSDESHPTSMEVTEKDAASGTTTVTTYDNGDWDHPASITVIENTQKTTTTYDESGKESATLDTIIIEITAGQNAGQKTIQKYDTTDGNPKTEETVISADRTAVVSSDYTSVNGKNIPKTETYYAAGYDYENPSSDANKLLKSKEIKYETSQEDVTGKTETSYDYKSGLTTAKDFDGTTITPYETVVTEKYSYTTDGKATLTETETTEYVYTDGTKSKMTVTETPAGSTEPAKITTTEYGLTQNNNGNKMRVTEVSGNKTTITRFADNTTNLANPVEKDETTVSDGVTTTQYFTGGEMHNPSMKVEKESTKTTTTEYVAGSEKTNKVTEIITSGENDGQKTETEYDTSGASSVKTIETVTSPDNHKTISTFDFSTANTEKKTTYQADWVPGGGENGSAVAGNPDTYNISSTLVTTSTGTVQTDYTYVRGLTTYNEFGTDEQIPQSTVTEVTKDTDGNVVSTATTTYDYSTNSLTNGKPNAITTVTTENGSTTTSAKVYTYDEYGRVTAETLYSATGVWIDGGVLDVGSFCIDGNKVAASSCTYDYVKMGVSVFPRNSTYTTSNGIASGAWKASDALFSVTASEENAIRCKNGAEVSKTEILQFLRDNYVVCGDTLASIDWVTNDTKDKAASKSFAYIYKADFEQFAKDRGGCFGYAIVGSNIYCVIHNDKSGCPAWDITKDEQKFSSYLIDNNIGTAGN